MRPPTFRPDAAEGGGAGGGASANSADDGDDENYAEPLELGSEGIVWTITATVLRLLTMVVSVMPAVADVTTLNGIRMFYPGGDAARAAKYAAAQGSAEASAGSEDEEEDDVQFMPPPMMAFNGADGGGADTVLVVSEREALDEMGGESAPPPAWMRDGLGDDDEDDVGSSTDGGGGSSMAMRAAEAIVGPIINKAKALGEQVVACRFLLSIYTVDALCMAVGKIMQFEVLWLIEERHACKFNYIVFTLILTLTEITIEFIASSVTPFIYRLVECGAPLTSKRLAVFSLKAYAASAIVSLIIYPPLGFIIHVLGGFDSAASFFFVMIFWGIQYAFMNQIGDAAVEMARPHWFRTFKGLSLTMPGVPYFCCCDSLVHHAWRRKLSKRADSHRDGVLENPGMAHVVREQIHSLQNRTYKCLGMRVIPDATSAADVPRAIHLRHRCNLTAAVTSSTLSVFLVLLKMLMGVFTLGPYFLVTQLKTKDVCKRSALCALCDKNINVPGVLRFFMAFCFSLVTVVFTLVLLCQRDRLIIGIVDEKVGEDEDEGVAVEVVDEENTIPAPGCCNKNAPRIPAPSPDQGVEGGEGDEEDGEIDPENQPRGVRWPWQMACFELSIVAFMVIAFTVPSQALGAFIVMVVNRVSSDDDEDQVIIDFDASLGIPTNGALNLTSKRLPALAAGLMFFVAFSVLVGKVLLAERKRQSSRMNRMFPGKKSLEDDPESRADAVRRERKAKQMRRKRRAERQRLREARTGGSRTTSRHAAAKRAEIEGEYVKERLTLVEDISRYAAKADMDTGLQDKVEEWWLGYGPRCGDVGCCRVLLKEHCPRIWCGNNDSPVERWTLMLGYETISIALATLALFALQDQSQLAIFFTLPLLLPFQTLQRAIEVQVQEFLFDYDEDRVTDIVFWSNVANVITNAPLLAVNWIAITYTVEHRETDVWPYDYYATVRVGDQNAVCPDEKWEAFVVNKAMYTCTNATTVEGMFCNRIANGLPSKDWDCQLKISATDLDPAQQASQSAILFGVTIAIFAMTVFFFAAIDPILPQRCNVHRAVAEARVAGREKRVKHQRKQELEQHLQDRVDRDVLRSKLSLRFDDNADSLNRHQQVDVTNAAFGGGVDPARLHVGGVHMAVHPTSFGNLQLDEETL